MKTRFGSLFRIPKMIKGGNAINFLCFNSRFAKQLIHFRYFAIDQLSDDEQTEKEKPQVSINGFPL